MSSSAPAPQASTVSRPLRIRAEWVALPILLLAVFVVFARTLGYQFVFDDPILIVNNPFIQSAANIPRFFTENFWDGIALAQKSYYRPLSLLYLLSNWKLFGADPAGWHAVSLVLHALNTALVYVLALRVLRGRSPAAFAAGAGACLFALHPIQAEAVSWICCFNDLLACMLVLISFHAYCSARGARIGFRTATGSRAVLWYFVSLAAYAAAVLCKEPAVLFPLIPLLCEWTGMGRAQSAFFGANSAMTANPNTGTLAGGHAARGRGLLYALPYFVIAAAYFVLRKLALGTLGTPQTRILYWHTEWFTLPSVLQTYLSHLLWPAGLSPFYDTPYQQQFSLAGVALPFLAVMIPATLLLWAAWRSVAARICVCWTVIFLAPTLHLGVLPRGELVHDRYVYMPMAGLGVLAALGIAAAGSRWTAPAETRHLLPIAAALLGVLLGAATFRQSFFWRDNLALYTRGVAIAPHNGTAANNLGAVLLGRGQWEEAMALFQRSIDEAPNLFLAHYDMGLGYYEAGRYAEAEASFKRAIALFPDDPAANLFLGMTYYHTSRLPEAIAQVRKAVALQPDGPGYHFALAVMLKESGDLAGARAEFEAELKRDPQHQATLQQLQLLDQASATAPAAKQ